MRRPSLLYLLIPAVLAATSALAYYSFQLQTRERQVMLDMMRELAREKVIGLRSEMEGAAGRLFDNVDLENIQGLQGVLTPLPFDSVIVLDADRRIVPGGKYTKRQQEDWESFEDLFLEEVIPELRLDLASTDEPRHLHQIYDGRPHLFSYVRRFSRGKTYYVVAEHDLNTWVSMVFPQYFAIRSRSIYQVVDESGAIVYGVPWTGIPEQDVVEVAFPEILSKYRLRVAQKDAGSIAKRAERQATVDFVLIGLALTVIVAGLGGLVVIVRRERRLNELKSEFISNVSHELKTPLSIISMFGELLSMGRVRSPEQATEYAEIIRRESVRLSRLIDNVLDFAKIERGADFYEFADGEDLAEVVSTALEISRPRLERAEMEANVSLAGDLPAVRMDRNAMTLAILNLVDNAIKYASEGRRLDVELRRKGGLLELSVRDHGPGIRPEEQDQVFERFYRSRSVRLKPIRGSGIGLALVKHIAEAHDGAIEVESVPGEGCTFRLWIPVAEDG